MLAAIAVLAGCGGQYEVIEHSGAEEGGGREPTDFVRACRFELSPQPLPVSRASWIAELDSMTERFWPSSMYADFKAHLRLKGSLGSRAPDWPDRRFDRVRFEPFRGPVASAAVRLDDRTVFLFSTLVRRMAGTEPGSVGGCFHDLTMVVAGPKRVEAVIARGIEAGRADAPLELAAAAADGRVVIAYATVDEIVEIIGAAEGDGVALDPTRVIRTTERPPGDLHLAAAGGRLHLIWSELPGVPEGPAVLRLVVAEGPGSAWTAEPQALTESAQPGTATIVADGEEVFVGWIDRRFNRVVPGGGHVMVGASRDGGRTFAPPVVVSDLADPADVAAKVFLARAEEGLVVFSAPPPAAEWPELWHAVTLDAELETATAAGDVKGRDLVSAYREDVEPLLLGATAPTTRRPERTASHPEG